MSLSTWNSLSPCVRCFLNLPQGVCGIQMELPVAVHSFSAQPQSLALVPNGRNVNSVNEVMC